MLSKKISTNKLSAQSSELEKVKKLFDLSDESLIRITKGALEIVETVFMALDMTSYAKCLNPKIPFNTLLNLHPASSLLATLSYLLEHIAYLNIPIDMELAKMLLKLEFTQSLDKFYRLQYKTEISPNIKEKVVDAFAKKLISLSENPNLKDYVTNRIIVFMQGNFSMKEIDTVVKSNDKNFINLIHLVLPYVPAKNSLLESRNDFMNTIRETARDYEKNTHPRNGTIYTLLFITLALSIALASFYNEVNSYGIIGLMLILAASLIPLEKYINYNFARGYDTDKVQSFCDQLKQVYEHSEVKLIKKADNIENKIERAKYLSYLNIYEIFDINGIFTLIEDKKIKEVRGDLGSGTSVSALSQLGVLGKATRNTLLNTDKKKNPTKTTIQKEESRGIRLLELSEELKQRGIVVSGENNSLFFIEFDHEDEEEKRMLFQAFPGAREKGFAERAMGEASGDYNIFKPLQTSNGKQIELKVPSNKRITYLKIRDQRELIPVMVNGVKTIKNVPVYHMQKLGPKKTVQRNLS